MAFFNWSEQFETGISEIDFQHRHLINLVNNLAEAKDEQDSTARSIIVKITLEQLLQYTVYHFENEEKFMGKAQYEHLQEHKKAHELLKSKALEINNRLENGEDILSDLLDFLKGWLQQHILVVDMAYVPSLKKAGVSQI